MRHGLAAKVRRAVAATALLGIMVGAPAAAPAHAESAFSVTTAYPTVETQPGSHVRLDIAVAAPAPEPVNLSVDGLPQDWTATLRGGGFVVHAVTAKPDSGATVSLELDVPPNTPPGSYPITITGTGPSGASQLVVTIMVSAQVDNGVDVTADFPTLTGDPSSAFNYTLTIANNTPEEQTFTFAPSGPQGWTVTASPTAEARAATVTIDAGSTSTVKVTATPPASAEQGSYPIDVVVTAANGATGNIRLTAEVTGTPELSLTTADQRLDVSGRSNKEKRVPLILANTGSAPLEDVKLAGTAPSGWNVSFEPATLPTINPNETVQATAIIQPSKDAVAGDYALTVRSSAGSQSANIDLRFALKGSRTLGVVAIVIIVAAFAGLAGVFLRFGRR